MDQRVRTFYVVALLYVIKYACQGEMKRKYLYYLYSNGTLLKI